MAKPINIVDVEEAIEAGGESTPVEGTRFCFNEVQLLKFKDGTSYHIQKQRAIISDKTLVANIKELAENPSYKIFIESEN